MFEPLGFSDLGLRAFEVRIRCAGLLGQEGLGKGWASGQLKPLKDMAAILNSPTSWTQRTKVVAHAMPAISAAEHARRYIGCVHFGYHSLP